MNRITCAALGTLRQVTLSAAVAIDDVPTQINEKLRDDDVFLAHGALFIALLTLLPLLPVALAGCGGTASPQPSISGSVYPGTV
jgi:hypothetical protein